ncbi:CoA transferase [Caulobacter sp. DWR1-3-2b1]|uniref:CoA transferase n=1 Tax=Caulobacter sp. DWR1-3-2b1 TaxID=2804670 RepID=UPI003CE6935E
MTAPRNPLTGVADLWVEALARDVGDARLAGIDGATLIGERAMLGGFMIPGRISAGGGCRLYDARDGAVALNLARAADRELLPALFETDALDIADEQAVAAQIAISDAMPLVARGRLMGLAIAAEREDTPPGPSCVTLVEGAPATPSARRPKVLDLSALWAGPLAGHLLWLAGAEVIKVESHTRPDAMRDGDCALFGLLNQGKASVALDFRAPDDRRALLALIAQSDIVIEAARPRALAQLGIDAGELVRAKPGLVWITITGHGADDPAADWVGFGDDCGVAAGLSVALRAASGRSGFVGDAIADPLTGIMAARVAWDAWRTGRGGRFGLSMRGVAAKALAEAEPSDLAVELKAWSQAEGRPFQPVCKRRATVLPAWGADTASYLARLPPC